MKVGDLVKLKPSVLSSTADLDMFDRFGNTNHHPEHLGVVVSRDHNAIKVHWFGEDDALKKPSTSQYVLKLIVVSEL